MVANGSKMCHPLEISHRQTARQKLTLPDPIGTCLALLLTLLAPVCSAQSFPPVAADQILSNHFVVTVDGRPAQVLHAALNLYFLNITAARHHRIAVTAPTDDFWVRGVEVQPWRLNIRPQVQGRTLTFDLEGEAKLTLSRPNDFLADAEMLYIFSNPPEPPPPAASTPNLHVYPPGIYRANIDAHSGDTLYLAPGAVLFGSLNVWQVNHVKVFGRGVLVYDGPQNPADDDGWMHKPNWHCIGMDKASDISIEGITCVVRSRTWQIQMSDSHRIVFDNIKVIGANSGNANADGMDWLGGGDTVVRNSFFRAADDVFALQSSWSGYTPEALAEEGLPVSNILIENTTVSTSISNIVRAAWPKKNFEGGNFRMRDSDVLHMGLGGCGIPFALMEVWADPDGRGQSSGFHFDNLRMEDWYTLFQLRQSSPGIRDVTFTDIMSPEQPALVPSVVQGSVSGVMLDNVVTAGSVIALPSALPVETVAAPDPLLADTGPAVQLRPVTGLVRPGSKVHLEAMVAAGQPSPLQYTWLFGDGTTAHSRKATHRFADTGGTLQDGSGRFRVLLHVTSAAGRSTWLYQPVIVSQSLQPAVAPRAGIEYTYTELPGITRSGTVATIDLAAVPHRPEHYALTLEGDIDAPVDGAYTILTIANDRATVTLDDRLVVQSPAPFAQVCGLTGNAARPLALYAALARGKHRLKVSEQHDAGQDDLRVLWQGPGFPMQPVSQPVAKPASQ